LLIVVFGMFLLMGFLRPNLWIYSIISLLAYILVNKLRTRILTFVDKFLNNLKKNP